MIKDKMAIKFYRLHCEICGYNKITDGSDIKLTEYKRSKIMADIPKLDPSTKKVTQKDYIALPKKFKCPKCGRLIGARKIEEAPNENKAKNDNDQNFYPGSEGSSERPQL